MTEHMFLLIFAGIFGLVLGSFCGSAGYRIAHEWSLFTPSGSHCPRCKRRLGWKENIPLVSFTIQRGRCRGCAAKLSMLYPIAETAFALWSVLLFWEYGLSGQYIEYVVFMAIGMILLLISLVDLEEYFIPDLLVLVGVVLAGGASIMGIGVPMPDALIAACVGTAIMQALRLTYQKLRKQEGMGFGDVKLMFFLGLCCGVMGLAYVFVLSAILALVCTLIANWRDVHKETRLPFGPYLCAGCAVYMLFEEQILHIFSFVR